MRAFKDNNQDGDNLLDFYEFVKYYNEDSKVEGIIHKCSLNDEDDK